MASLSDSFTPSVGRLRTFLTGQRNDPGTAPPEPSPPTPAWQPMAPSGDASRVTPSNPAGIKFAHGGRVRGPGTGTSDSIKARLSDGEYVLPTDTVAAMGGADALDRVKDATHQPVRSLAGGFANGGEIDPLQPKPTSFGDAAAASNGAGVTQPRAPVAAQPGVAAFDNVRASVAPTAPAAVPGPATPMQSTAEGLASKPIPGSPADPAFHGNGRYGAPANPTIANSFGDAAAAAKTPGVTQVAAAAEPVVARTGMAGLADKVVGGARAVGNGVSNAVLHPVDTAVAGAKGVGRGLISPAFLAASGAAAGIEGAGSSLFDLGNGYRDKSQADLGADSPMSSIAADTARTLGNVGNAATFGYAGKVGQGLSDAFNGGSFLKGFSQDTDRDAYLKEQKNQRDAPAAAAAAAPVTQQFPPAGATNTHFSRIDNSFDQGTTMPGDLGSVQRNELGVKNQGVGVVGAAGVTSTDTLGQMNRDLAHMREMNALNKGQAGFSGVLGTSYGLFGTNEERQKFFDEGNLRSAAAKGSWSPRGGYKSDDSAIAAAQASITARNQRQIADSKNLADSTAARMTDATNRRDTDVRADAAKYGADATYKAATLKNSYDQQLRNLHGQVWAASGGKAEVAANTAASLGLDPAPYTAMAAASQAREGTTQTQGDIAEKGMREATQVFTPDNKLDPAGSASAYDVVAKLFKGAAMSDPVSRAAAMPKIKMLSDIYGKTAQGNQMGVAAWNPFDPKASPLDSMPQFKGGELIKASASPGTVLTPGIKIGEFYVRQKNGTQVPIGKLSEEQEKLINENTKTGKWN